MRTFRLIPAGALILLACEPSTAPDAAGLARAPSGARYTLQFVTQDPLTEGEIISEPFPDGGLVLDARDPFRNLTIQGVTLTLVSPTHGNVAAYPCNTYADTPVTWEIGTNPQLTFAGTWTGELRLWTTRGGQNLAYRATAETRTIDNVASNNNQVVRTDTPTGFRMQFRNARMGFGSPSRPDGVTSLGALPGYEAACANFTIVGTRM